MSLSPDDFVIPVDLSDLDKAPAEQDSASVNVEVHDNSGPVEVDLSHDKHELAQIGAKIYEGLLGQLDHEIDYHIQENAAKIKAEEDRRANKRNFNRMLTLVGALVIGLIVTFTLSHGYLGHFGFALAPYSFTITILLDSSLALYSFIKRY